MKLLLFLILLAGLPLQGMSFKQKSQDLKKQFKHAIGRGGLYRHDSQEEQKKRHNAGWIHADTHDHDTAATFLKACFPVDLETQENIIKLIEEYYAFDCQAFFRYIPIFATVRPIVTEHPIEMLAALSSYQLLAANSEDYRLFLFDIKQDYKLCDIVEPAHKKSTIAQLAKNKSGTISVLFADKCEGIFDPGNKTLIMQSNAHALYEIDLTDDELLRHEIIALPNGKEIVRYGDRVQFPDKLVSLSTIAACLINDGKSVILVTKNSLETWDTETAVRVKKITIPEYSVSRVVPVNNDCVATLFPESLIKSPVKLWSLSTGKCMQTIEMPQRAQTALMVAPDDSTLVLAGSKALFIYRLEQEALEALAGLTPQQHTILQDVIHQLNDIKEKNALVAEKDPLIVELLPIASSYSKLPCTIQAYLKEYYQLVAPGDRVNL